MALNIALPAAVSSEKAHSPGLFAHAGPPEMRAESFTMPMEQPACAVALGHAKTKTRVTLPLAVPANVAGARSTELAKLINCSKWRVQIFMFDFLSSKVNKMKFKTLALAGFLGQKWLLSAVFAGASLKLMESNLA